MKLSAFEHTSFYTIEGAYIEHTYVFVVNS